MAPTESHPTRTDPARAPLRDDELEFMPLQITSFEKEGIWYARAEELEIVGHGISAEDAARHVYLRAMRAVEGAAAEGRLAALMERARVRPEAALPEENSPRARQRGLWFLALPKRTASSATIEQRVNRLADEWKKQGAHLSSVERMAMLPPFKEITSYGQAALAPILRRLQRDPDWWFEVLRVITGENPVPPEAQGDLKAMTEAWLDWGRRHKLI